MVVGVVAGDVAGLRVAGRVTRVSHIDYATGIGHMSPTPIGRGTDGVGSKPTWIYAYFSHFWGR